MTTAYHAKYFAHELTKRCPSDSVQKFAASLANAQVDLNPHQVEAALFAFRSPLTKGAILADEVGLGKTIEAGILLSQKWAERKRKLLIIVPSNLRKQWNQELMDKFFLPSVILEKKSFEQAIKDDNLNPFEQTSIVICSYHFARSKDVYIRKVKWDLVVIDEAHRLRNVYKPSNKIANTIKRALADFPKVLLTATPLQNSLLELFGLVSIIDDHTFGDLKSFKGQFAKLSLNGNFDELKKRLQPVCKRTLRRQVMEYIKYTNRIPITQEFVPSPDEQKLYDLVSDYLQKPNLFALPPSQRQLMTLILRKLLASSTYAIAGTLQALVDKLEDVARQKEVLEIPLEEVTPGFENVDELEEEWTDDSTDDETEKKKYSSDELKQINEEIKTLKSLKADWIVSYTAERANAFKGFNVYRVKRRNQMRGPGGNQEWVTELLISKNKLQPLNLYIDKDLDPKPEGMESEMTLILPQYDDVEDLEKLQGAFKSPGGKFRLCKKLVPMIPEHKTFVEGFCGGAQVFFHKKRSNEEVLNDINPDLIFAYRFLKKMDDKDHEWLGKQYWVISRSHVKKVFNHEPRSPRERFYRIAYLNKANYWGRTDRIEGMRTGAKGEGYKIQLVPRLPEIKERLQGVKLLNKDWREVIKLFDSSNAFFYLDPPYPNHWPDESRGVGSKFFKEDDLLDTLHNIKGRFLLSYELEKSRIFKGFKTYRVKTLWTGANQLGHRSKFELLVSNYPVKESDLYVER